jgi:SpoIIAA-like
MATKILWEPHVVVCHADGKLSIDDITQLNDETFSDPRFSEVESVLVDFSEVTSTSITNVDVTIFASSDRLYGQLDHPRRMAIVVDPQLQLRQLSELYQREVEDTPLEIEFFADKTSARNWLSWVIAENGELS